MIFWTHSSIVNIHMASTILVWYLVYVVYYERGAYRINVCRSYNRILYLPYIQQGIPNDTLCNSMLVHIHWISAETLWPSRCIGTLSLVKLPLSCLSPEDQVCRASGHCSSSSGCFVSPIHRSQQQAPHPTSTTTILFCTSHPPSLPGPPRLPCITQVSFACTALQRR